MIRYFKSNQMVFFWNTILPNTTRKVHNQQNFVEKQYYQLIFKINLIVPECIETYTLLHEINAPHLITSVLINGS